MNLTPSMNRIINALTINGDMDSEEISESAHVCRGTLTGGGYLMKLLVMKKIRVSRWKRQLGPGPFIPVYSVSPGENKPKPEPITAAQKCKRWKKRAGYYKPEYRQRRKARESLRAIISITSTAKGNK